MGRRTPTPPATLPVAAESAWRAYCAMLASKDAHFEALSAAHTKSGQGAQPSLSEQAYLAKLLSTHDARVAEFSNQMRALGVENKDAQLALLNAITLINRDLGSDNEPGE